METRTQAKFDTPKKGAPDIKAILNIIEIESANFHGQLDDLYQVCGLLLVGQLYGWRVMRLISTRPNWRMASKMFGKYAPDGDIKSLMPEHGDLEEKSLGYRMIRNVSQYWDVVKGIESMPKQERKAA